MVKLVSVKKRKDFNKVYSRGKNFVARDLVVYVYSNYKKGIRVGITASKKVGNSPERNRARRIIREAARNILSEITGNYDIIFVARQGIKNAKSTQLHKIMEKSVRKLIFDVEKSKYDRKGRYHEKNK
ncbi:MAG: ribonuclease P protein component [Clostridia bacterium]|nr:ribonuclease P protein component [Clostridia bacterium]